MKPPTMQDVAVLSGTSLKTVSRVVNDEPHVAPETAGKVHQAIAALGFQRNEMAALLRRRGYDGQDELTEARAALAEVTAERDELARRFAEECGSTPEAVLRGIRTRLPS